MMNLFGLPCRSVHSFDKASDSPWFVTYNLLTSQQIELRGEGTYGQVFMARDKVSQNIMALKRVRMEKEKEGFPVTALRELTLVKRLKHPHIVNLVEIVVGNKLDSIFLVFEYCQHDLGAIVDSSSTPPFTEPEIKRLLIQLFDAVAFMHEHWVIHRDLKMSNLLYNKGCLKICDFGLARDFGTPLKPYTPRVVTLWYRAPELMLGTKTYSCAIDIWACGCIMGELLGHCPLLPGRNEFDQLQLTYGLLGSPNDVIWPGFSALPNVAAFKLSQQPYNNLSQRFAKLSKAGVDMLDKLLTYDPDKRPRARQCLHHEYLHGAKPAEAMPAFPQLAARGGGGGGGGGGGAVAGHKRKRSQSPGKGR